MAKMGKIFQQEISNSLKILPNCWFHKFIDHAGMSFDKDKVARFSLPLPADFVGCIRGRSFLIEAKTITSKITSVPFSAITDNQYINLRSEHEAGGLSYVLINIRNTDINKTFVLNFEEFDYLKKNTDRKSITLSELFERRQLLRVKLQNSYGWDISPLFQEVK